jgi:hypothetical protein
MTKSYRLLATTPAAPDSQTVLVMVRYRYPAIKGKVGRKGHQPEQRSLHTACRTPPQDLQHIYRTVEGLYRRMFYARNLRWFATLNSCHRSTSIWPAEITRRKNKQLTTNQLFNTILYDIQLTFKRRIDLRIISLSRMYGEKIRYMNTWRIQKRNIQATHTWKYNEYRVSNMPQNSTITNMFSNRIVPLSTIFLTADTSKYVSPRSAAIRWPSSLETSALESIEPSLKSLLFPTYRVSQITKHM